MLDTVFQPLILMEERIAITNFLNKAPLPPLLVLLGSPMPMDPSQQYVISKTRAQVICVLSSEPTVKTTRLLKHPGN